MALSKEKYLCLDHESIKISYFDPLSIFDSIKSEIDHLIPLRDLHWKSSPESPVLTIKKLKVEFVPENVIAESSHEIEMPFIKYIIVKCTSVEEYRAKIRPLIKQWISTHPGIETPNLNNFVSFGALLLTSSSDNVHNTTTIFKSVSIFEKLIHDFPILKVYQLHTVYRSPMDKTNHWNQYAIHLKKCLLDVFQRRLGELNKQSESIAQNDRLLQLYLNFQIYGKSKWHMKKIDNLLNLNTHVLGELKLPLFNSGIADTIISDSISVFEVLRYKLVRQLSIIECLYPLILLDRVKDLYIIIIKDFLQEIKARFYSSSKLDQFLYEACGEILNLAIFPNLSLNKEEPNYQAWKELIGEIMLIQRESWMQLADQSQDYIVFLGINDNQKDSVNESFKSHFASKDSTLKQFLLLTSNVIENLRGVKEHTVDILSLQIADAFFQCEKYEETAALLQSSYEYYSNEGWDAIATEVLIKYTKCLEKIKLKNITIENEEIPVLSVLAKSYLNLVTNNCVSNKKAWWDKFLALNECTQLVYPLDLFVDVSFEQSVFLSDSNTYAISLSISDLKTKTNVSIDTMKLVIKNKKENRLMVFTKQDTNLNFNDANDFVLETLDVSYGEFDFVSFEMITGKTVFSKAFTHMKPLLISPLYSKSNFSIKVQKPKNQQKGHSLLEILEANETTVDKYDCEIKIIEPEEMTFSDSGTNIISFNNNSMKPFIQYNCDTNKTFVLRLEQTLVFERNGKTYKDEKNLGILHICDISLVVEHILKADLFYLKFSIDSTESPLLVWRTDLSPNDKDKNRDIIGGYESEDTPFLLENDSMNPFQAFFKVTDNGHSFQENDEYTLKISYTDLTETLNAYLTEEHFDKNKDFESLRYIWENYILNQFEYHRPQLLNYDTIKVSNYDKTKFEKHIRKFVASEKDIAYFLNFYEMLFEGIKIDKNLNLYRLNRQKLKTLEIPIQSVCPKNNCIFTASMSFEHKTDNCALNLGEPYKCTLTIQKNYQSWNGKTTLDDEYAYECEIDRNIVSEEWLLNGMKKFEIQDDKTEVHLELIPVRRGYLRFPRIDVFVMENSNSGEYSTCNLLAQAQINSTQKIEVDFINNNDNIIVV